MRERALHAKAHADAGRRVFPLDPLGKRPAVEAFPEVATNCPDRVRKWWTDPFGEPLERNIGIATGRGLIVLDFDCKPGQHGAQSYFELDMQGLAPPTYSVRTPSGGLHLYYRAPESHGPVANSASKIARNVDVRGDGGYVVAPGSETEQGAYVVEEDLPIAEAPAELLRRCGRPRERSELAAVPLVDLDDPAAVLRAREYLETAEPSVMGAGGDATAFRTAARVKDFGVSEPMAAALLLDHWNERCAPPWSPEEIETKVANAYSYGKDPIGVASAAAEFEAVDLPAGVETGAPAGLLPVQNIGAFEFQSKQDYVVRNLLNFGMVGLMTGPSEAGKSPLVLDMAAHVAKGEPWQGRKVRRGYVLYLSTEGWTGIKGRMEALRREHFAGSNEVPLDFVAGALDLRSSPKDAKMISATVNARAAHFGARPALVIVDTLSHALGGGDESNPEHCRALLANGKRIAAATGAAVMFLHHPTKDAGSDYRGWSGLLNDTDLLVKVDKDAKSGISTVTTPRAKEYAHAEPMHFKVKVVELGRDEEDDPVTSIVADFAGVEFEPLPEDGAAAAEAWEEFQAGAVSEGTAEPRGNRGLAFKTGQVVAFFGSTARGARKQSQRTVERLIRQWSDAGWIENIKKGQWVTKDPPTIRHHPPGG